MHSNFPQEIDEQEYPLNFQNEHTFKRVYHKYYTMLYNLAKKKLSDRQLALTIANDSFLKLQKVNPTLKTEKKLKYYILVICVRLCYDHLNSREFKIKKDNLDDHNDILRSDIAIDNDMIKAEVYKAVADEINSLPTQQKEVIKRLFFDKLSIEETAMSLGISQQTVRNHKTKALENLRNRAFVKSLRIMLFAWLYINAN